MKKTKINRSKMGKNIDGVIKDKINTTTVKSSPRKTVIKKNIGNVNTNLNNQKLKSSGTRTKAVYKNGVIKINKVTDYKNDNGLVSGVVTKTKFKGGMPKKEVKRSYVSGKLISKKKY